MRCAIPPCDWSPFLWAEQSSSQGPGSGAGSSSTNLMFRLGLWARDGQSWRHCNQRGACMPARCGITLALLLLLPIAISCVALHPAPLPSVEPPTIDPDCPGRLPSDPSYVCRKGPGPTSSFTPLGTPGFTSTPSRTRSPSRTPAPAPTYNPRCPGNVPSDPPYVCRKGPRPTASSAGLLLHLTPGPWATSYACRPSVATAMLCTPRADTAAAQTATQEAEWARLEAKWATSKAATARADASHDLALDLTRTVIPYIQSTPVPFEPMATAIAVAPGFPWVGWLDADAPLEARGPWLVYYSPDEFGLVARNEDGTGKTVLWSGSMDYGSLNASPSGGRVAFRPNNEPRHEPGGWAPPDHALVSYSLDGPDQPHLLVLRIPSGKIEARLELLGEDARRAWADRSEDPEQDWAWISIKTTIASPVWSPNGRYLAFPAAIEGSNTDLYVYDTETRATRRLTTGESHVYRPSWSPDSEWILHQAVSDAGRGHDAHEGPFWVARPDGSEVRLVQATATAPQRVLGWTSGSTFLLSSSYFDRGLLDLREVNIENGGQRIIHPGYLPQLALSLDQRTMLLGYHPDYPPREELLPEPSGIYLRSFYNPDLTPLLSLTGEGLDRLQRISWDDAIQRFVVQFSDRVLAFDSKGHLHADRSVPEAWHTDSWGSWQYAPSPDGQWIAILGGSTGLLLCTPEFDCQVSINKGLSSRYAKWALWSPDSNYLFFSNGNWNAAMGVAHIPFRELSTDHFIDLYGPRDFAWVQP